METGRRAASPSSTPHARQEIGVGEGKPVAKPDLRSPTQTFHASDIHQLAGRAVRLGGVEGDASLITYDLANGFGEIPNREVLAGTDIDVREHRLGIARVSVRTKLHDVQTGLRHIVHIEKFAHWRAGSPNRALGGAFCLGS